ncbi:MAG: ABC transporter ATP-binding protein [Methanobacteriota archaeon]
MTLADIVLKDVIKAYRMGDIEVLALRGIDATIPSGRSVAVVGPSGCGKTTLLNLVAGLDRPTVGSILVDDMNLARLPDAELVRYRRERVGIVFQFLNLVPMLTARENVEMPLRLLGRPADLRFHRSDELLGLVGMAHRADHRPDALSGGEQQRVAIAVALANDPAILVADEPTGELDSENATRVLEVFRDVVRAQGKTALIASHDPRVRGYVDDVITMADGRITDAGPRDAPSRGSPGA